jgi:hypothetical protein
MLRDQGKSYEEIKKDLIDPYIETKSQGNEYAEELITRNLIYEGVIDPLHNNLSNDMKPITASEYAQNRDNAKLLTSEVNAFNIMEVATDDEATREIRSKYENLTPEQRVMFNEIIIGGVGEEIPTKGDRQYTTGMIMNVYKASPKVKAYMDKAMDNVYKYGKSEQSLLLPNESNINKLASNNYNNTKYKLIRAKYEEKAGAVEPKTKIETVTKGRSKVQKPPKSDIRQDALDFMKLNKQEE